MNAGGKHLRAACAALALMAISGCDQYAGDADRPETSRQFPRADRPVSDLGANQFSTETQRDRVGEAQKVMDLAEIKPGMTVADIGAGEGYYTVRLAKRVGPTGRVLAQDIDREALDRLARRVERERFDNVSIKPGEGDDPRLPENSFDRIFLVHMYHEVEQPYPFLWHLREGLKPGGLVVVVDANRPVKRHGMPPALLECEFDSLGLTKVREAALAGSDSYMVLYAATKARPEPGAIKPCSVKVGPA